MQEHVQTMSELQKQVMEGAAIMLLLHESALRAAGHDPVQDSTLNMMLEELLEILLLHMKEQETGCK